MDRRPRRVLVTGAHPLAAGLALGLAAQGDEVVVTASAPVPDGAIRTTPCTFSSEEEVAGAVAAAAGSLGGLDQVVHAWLAPDVLVARDLVDVEPGPWAAAAEASLDAGWWVSRSIGRPLAASARGSAVFVVPSVGLTGAAGFAMLAAVSEGLRVLATSCGRQWAGRGVTVNTVVTALHHWTDTPPVARLAPLVAALGGDDTRVLTAATLLADGGPA